MSGAEGNTLMEGRCEESERCRVARGRDSAKLTCEARRERGTSLSFAPSSPNSRLLRIVCASSSFVSCKASPILSSPSSSESSSSSSSFRGRPLVISQTPKKVKRQPPMNLIMSSALARWKSRYNIALPIITDSVNITNWTGMTCVESNLWRALFTYLTCIIAVPTSIATRT